MFFFFNDTTTSEIYTLSLHDALPILGLHRLKLANALKSALSAVTATVTLVVFGLFGPVDWQGVAVAAPRSGEDPAEIQLRPYLVCRLLLSKKKYLKITLLLSLLPFSP